MKAATSIENDRTAEGQSASMCRLSSKRKVILALFVVLGTMAAAFWKGVDGKRLRFSPTSMGTNNASTVSLNHQTDCSLPTTVELAFADRAETKTTTTSSIARQLPSSSLHARKLKSKKAAVRGKKMKLHVHKYSKAYSMSHKHKSLKMKHKRFYGGMTGYWKYKGKGMGFKGSEGMKQYHKKSLKGYWKYRGKGKGRWKGYWKYRGKGKGRWKGMKGKGKGTKGKWKGNMKWAMGHWKRKWKGQWKGRTKGKGGPTQSPASQSTNEPTAALINREVPVRNLVILYLCTHTTIRMTYTPLGHSFCLQTLGTTVRLDQVGTISVTSDFSYTTEVTVSDTCGTVEGLDELTVDVCLVADASGSFNDDLPNLIAASTDIFNTVTSLTRRARFGVTAFSDYPSGVCTDFGDYPYRVYQPLSDSLDDWEKGIRAIDIESGNDFPESQFDAIVGAAQGLSNSCVNEPDCGWSSDPSIQRIMVVTTDATFQVPGSGRRHENDLTSTTEVLQRERIRVVGLTASGSGEELDSLSAATGGNVQPLSRDGSDIASAILGGLEALPCQVTATAVGCDPLDVVFDPSSQVVEPGASLTLETTFSTTSSVPVGTVVTCDIIFTANGEVVGSARTQVTVTE